MAWQTGEIQEVGVHTLDLLHLKGLNRRGTDEAGLCAGQSAALNVSRRSDPHRSDRWGQLM